jgi:parallel beta-helix repeat protein
MKHAPDRTRVKRSSKLFKTLVPRITLGAACLITANAAMAADWYVDGVNGNNRNAGTAESPFKDVWYGWSRVLPGDTLHLLPTTTYGPLYFHNRSGTQAAPITIRGAGTRANMTKVDNQGKNMALFLDGVNYVNVENLDITATGRGNRSSWSGIYSKNNHHVRIVGNYVHDAACSGIQTQHSDYVTIMGNRVERNAKDTYKDVFCSGISTHENLDSDDKTGTKFWILNNIISGNTNTRWEGCTAPCLNSDGNGIIIDDTRRTQTDYRAFKGKTLIQNNVIFNNGGRGIAIFYSDNVEVKSNTLFHNNQDPYEGSWRPGEIGITHSAGVSVTSNVFVTDGLYGSKYTGKHVAVLTSENGGGSKLPIVVDQNVVYSSNNDTTLRHYSRNNTVPVTFGSNNKWGNPLFKTASKDPKRADFRVTAGSPALSFTTPAGLFASKDFSWFTRGLVPTAGAYQLPAK